MTSTLANPVAAVETAAKFGPDQLFFAKVSLTINGQTAAEMLGVELDCVTMHLGDSRFPESPDSGGHWGAASSTAGVYATCVKLRNAIIERLGYGVQTSHFSQGRVTDGERHGTLIERRRNG